MSEVEGPFVLSVNNPEMFSRGDSIQIGDSVCIVAKSQRPTYLTVKGFPRWKQWINRICYALDIPPLFHAQLSGAIIVFKQ